MHGVVQPRRGAIVLEVMCALAIMTLVLGLVATLLIRYRNAQDYFLTRCAAQLAAEGMVERFRAGETPTPGAVTVGTGSAGGTATVHVEPGTGDWAGLDVVTVTVTLRVRNRPVEATVVTYMDPVTSEEPRRSGASTRPVEGSESP